MARRRVERNVYYDDARKKYYVNFDFGLDSETGTQVKKMKTFHRITEARAALHKHEAARDVGQVVMPKEITVAEWLKSWMTDVLQREWDNKEALGDSYQDSGYVFTHEDGRSARPNYASELFTKFVKDNGLPLLTLHRLRYPYVKPKTKNMRIFLESAGGTRGSPEKVV